MSDRSLYWRYFGSSVRGLSHARAGLPNQDAWLGAGTRDGLRVVLADGLGSAEFARQGSQAACRATLKAMRHWGRADGPPVGVLIDLLEGFWRLEIGAGEPAHYAATCLFAMSLPDDRVLIGQLGDGLALWRWPDGRLVCLSSEREGFANQTASLGSPDSRSRWRLHETRAIAGASLCLLTDGIGDDLLPEQFGEFLGYVERTYAPLPPRQRHARLARDLRNWPSPRHGDDKSLLFCWSE